MLERDRVVIDLRRKTNRKAVASFSPTLPLRLRWEMGQEIVPTATRLRRFSSRYVPDSARSRNPVGVGNSTINRSQGSRNGNPGLKDATALRFISRKLKDQSSKIHIRHAAPFGNSW